MKFTFKKNINIIACITFTILLYFLCLRWNLFQQEFLRINKVLLPFYLGLSIAIIFNRPMVFLEEKIKKKIQVKRSIARVFALGIISLISVVFILFLFVLVFPNLIQNINDFFVALPKNIEVFWVGVERIASKNNIDLLAAVEAFINSVDWKTLIPSIMESFSKYVIDSSVGILTSVTSMIFNISFGFVIAIYILMGKEKLVNQSRKLLYAVFSKERAQSIFHIIKETYRLINCFIFGKFMDSLIMGLLTALGMYLLKLPYIGIVSVVIAITNMLPIIGPFIGLLMGTLLLSLTNINGGITFFIFEILLQQFDGNVISPKIIGNQLELPALWTLFAIILGGALFGILGMFLGVPIFALIYATIKEKIHDKLDKKGIDFKTP